MKRSTDEGEARSMALGTRVNQSQRTSLSIPPQNLYVLSPPLPYCHCLYSHFVVLASRVTADVNRRVLADKGDMLGEPNFAFSWGLP